MKKASKVVSNAASTTPENALSMLGRYVVRGILAGTIF